MAAPIIKSAAHIPGAGKLDSPPRTLDFLLNEANGYRSRDVIQVPQAPPPGMWPGSFVDATGGPAATAGAITGILAYATNPADGPYNQTVIARDAEVTDAYLHYGALDPVAVNARLATLGIIVRAGVFKNVTPPGFAPDQPPSGPPVSGIQSVGTDGQPAAPESPAPEQPQPLPTGRA